ncbi:MAG: aconitate hydratase AcnA [Phycisphaerales bacterium]|jgi:aconitate hydratase|nr:aconitate hydratase AcnA [Phycisphaerales bacterium]MDP6310620.1 aconitate hydratase AcnA [Phycisphaerales bacterium]MDP7189987.1 aconitate hydratase AcnA [Phycisphaerales bacterium]MDP7519864.1 aconitate hydratase AcnA [Phycisphaerales bacterium]HJN80387.1 aconitate hydratase AcnA [Phycisphaerales bacterium]
MSDLRDPFGTTQIIDTPFGQRRIASLRALTDHLGHDLDTVPFSIRVLLEACLRHCDGEIVTEDDVRAMAAYDAANVTPQEIPFQPGRVVLQDFTGVPAIVDLAAMRTAMVDMTGSTAAASLVNPLVPCDLVIDHSVQVDAFNSDVALTINAEYEFKRNQERYEFLKWGQQAFDNFRVVPPATGIVHQVNLEYLAKVVWDDGDWLYPDSLVGTDSHTTMINGLGVLGWGVGGIEAEACMLGQPISMLIPEVVGVRLSGQLPEGCTATDLVLRITQLLRQHGVVGKFVEFFGPGLTSMPLATRATIANMAPEYGATMGFFPVDDATLRYLELTGRDEDLIAAVEQYCKANGFWHTGNEDIRYSATVDLDLGTIEPAMAGPKRPQDRITLTDMKSTWQTLLASTPGHAESSALVDCEGESFELKDGAVVIAAITSCTNTSNPDVMVAAGLVARKAAALGLTRKPWVKTSLAPGSKVVTDYLQRGELLSDLEAVGFYTVGYGCTTCIGNSGPLPAPIHDAIETNDLIATSVLSGNRNFEGRISPDIRANYLASPPLVVAYAIAGTVDIDLASEPLGQGSNGQDVYLRDIWPTQAEVDEVVAASIGRDQFLTEYGDVFTGSDAWQDISAGEGELFGWSDASTYIHLPPFFEGISQETPGVPVVQGARVLCLLGDSVTTDHISPAGSISVDSPAGQWLLEHGVEQGMFNSYGSRRGNDLVMTRGTFGNIRVRNGLAPGTEGGWTTDFTTGAVTSIFEASEHYRAAGTPLVVLAGKDYGMGSSRDWAAKGTFLLGVRAVIAESYERIHRSNLVGMGVVPLEFTKGQSASSLGLSGREVFDIDWGSDFAPRQTVTVTATSDAGVVTTFEALLRVDTPIEVIYIQNGGILHTVLRRMAAAAAAPTC